MDTSSKTWLPHQGQFGLVGQAEVCCGGPGVLTPSFFVPLYPPLEHHSPSEHHIDTLPSVLCCHPLGLIAPFSFYTAFDRLQVFLLSSSVDQSIASYWLQDSQHNE
ncbi:hypothetical protein ATANTOWER_018114 [Ataeniobius toweri]|uniref:Uncharacterized protein n=1 Tax=Ataeniobius toweri TaxID=208326 RepID=A0ABU7CLD1_9TELE|nr:hypothetical protein [Ataeniobius toweri]